MNVFVLGGGASGMVAAIVSRRCGNNVTIIEKNSLGKKLLLTGAGKCNYFNDDMNLTNFSSNGDITKIINPENLEKVTKFFDSIGVVPYVKNGYYYPYSNTSYAILNALKKEIEVLGIKIINEEVTDITRDKIYTNIGEYAYDKVILSFGGASYTKTGSDGFGYKLLKKLGHNIIPIKPALVPLKSSKTNDWKGIRCKAKVSIYVGGDNLASSVGEVQLTEYGISGICVMNISRFFDKTKKNYLTIDFAPDILDISDFLIKQNNKLKERTIIELLESVINYKLLYSLFKSYHIPVDSKLADVDMKTLKDMIKNYKLDIVDTLGFDYAEVTSGGVSLDEVTSTLESKIVKNLYITGELLDIDGNCGGYNLTNAWITGILAGEEND